MASIFSFVGFNQDTLAQGQENHSQESSTQTSQTGGYIPESYEYVIKPGNNQTLLVRRCLQLYDLADGSLELSPAQLIYAETNVVNELGRTDLIYPEQVMEVMADLVAEYAKSSQHLSAAKTSIWQVYANQANLDTDYIQARNVSLDSDGNVVASADLDQDLVFSTNEGMQTAQPESSNWHIWLIAAGTIALLAYVFWRVQEPQID